MPRYAFKCEQCGSIRDENFKNVLEADLANLYCRECEEPDHRLTRIFTAPNFHIKGYNAKNGYSAK